MPKTILEVIDLKKHFTQRKGLLSAFKEEQKTIPAVDGVSFYLKENETVGLVGESGCGKTTIGRTILRLEKPTSGKIIFDGKDITSVPTEELRRLRGQMQMIFQDLDAALNPKMRIREILKEAITVHHPMTDAEADKRTGELLEMVNLKKVGHQAILVVGDFTGMIGDPSEKKKTRPMLTREDIERNVASYRDQYSKILDPARTRVVFNSQWLAPLTFEGVLRLAAKTTVARILERD